MRKAAHFLLTILVGICAAVGALFLTLAQLAITTPRQALGSLFSNQITEAFVEQYESNFHVLGQQMACRFEPYVMVKSGIVGKSAAAERVGRSEAYDINNRHADTQYVETPHSRRWLDLADKGWADLVDEMDEIRMLSDPKSIYPRLAVAALNRKKDDVIYAAARGSARTNSGTTALPSAQKIAVGGTGLTLAKLLSTKELMDTAELVEEGMGDSITGQGVNPNRVIVCRSKDLTTLYGTTEIKSIDYNNVKALAQGQIDTFLGFKFIRSERIYGTGGTSYVLAWTKSAMKLGIGKDIVSSIDKLPTKNMSVQVYARMSLGAVRIEDEGVVEVAVTT